MWNPWKVSDPWQLPNRSVSDVVRADSGEGKLMLRGVTGLLVGAAVALAIEPDSHFKLYGNTLWFGKADGNWKAAGDIFNTNK
jgi:hypothetical protein